MKKYNVFKLYASIGSVTLKYSTEEFEDAKTMRDLLAKQDEEFDYVIMSVVNP